MQKQKIDSLLYVAIQNSTENVEIALFNKQTLIEKKSLDKFVSSKSLIPTIDDILKINGLKISDLTFLCANKGPGPYTTLRVVIASVNGLGFGGNLPLIGIDGLEAFLNEFTDDVITVAILNAFNQDVYYGIKINDGIEIGCKNINELLIYLKLKFENRKMRFIGNGVNLFENEIIKNFNESAIFENPNPMNCSIEQVAKISYEKWIDKQDICNQILPIYLKTAVN